ncbi:IS66 family transposase [Paraflavisolibacter sp. H34]|uniref:IS66 family transposase n=1 Tax=Huijunlia imazamoxiresistens TaxID=3127457 RepID=UPI003018E135
MPTPPAIDYKALYEETKPLLDEALQTIALLRHENAQLKKMLFGSRRERFVSSTAAGQQPTESKQEARQDRQAGEVQAKQVSSTLKTAKNPVSHPGRSPLSSRLRRIDIVVEPDFIPEGSIRIGEEVTEQLEYIPGELVVKRTIRPRYLVPRRSLQEGTKIITAPLPVEGVFKCIAGPGLLSQILIDKFIYHLPAYRQMQRFEQNGISIAYSTLIAWIGLTANLLEVLYDALRKELQQSGYLHADETEIKVLDNSKAGKKIHRGYFWVYNNSIKRLVYFDYQRSRNKEAPKAMLAGFRGYLHTDRHEVYNDYDNSEHIIHLNCMAHARRYFVEALETSRPEAEYALQRIQQLYAIERRCREAQYCFDKIKEIRQEESVPILKSLGGWIGEKKSAMQAGKVLPQSPLGKAITYCSKRWEKLCRYTGDGMLLIDNNQIENAIRPVALGRRNFLFAGSHTAAHRTAMIYSLVGCCKMHDLNPYEWLKDVLTRLPMHPINRIKELLPHNWKPLQAGPFKKI